MRTRAQDRSRGTEPQGPEAGLPASEQGSPAELWSAAALAQDRALAAAVLGGAACGVSPATEPPELGGQRDIPQTQRVGEKERFPTKDRELK